MRRHIVLIVVALAGAALIWAATVNGSLNVLGTLTAGMVDFTAAGSTAPMKSGTALPGTCTVGQTFFKTDAVAGQNIHLCTAVNTWSQVIGGSGGGGYATIKDEGTALPARSAMNFYGRGVLAEDGTVETNLYFLDPRKYVFEWDDFIQQGSTGSNISKFNWALSGAAIQALNAPANHPGVLQWTASAGAAGTLYIGSYNNGGIAAGDMKSMLFIIQQNSDTDFTNSRVGLINATTTAFTDGIYIENDKTDTGWWGAVMNALAETRTAAQLGAFAANTWTVMYLEKIASNQVRFKVAGTIADALDPAGAQTITATLPTASCRVVVQGAVETGGAQLYTTVDYVDFLVAVTR